MILHVPTLFALLATVSSLLAALMLAGWLRNRRIAAYLWAASGATAAAIGLILIMLGDTVRSQLSIDIGSAGIALGIGLAWASARVFDGRPVRVSVVVAGLALWLIACAVPEIHGNRGYRSAVLFAIIGSYSLVIAGEYWRGRKEGLASRLPLVAVCATSGVLYFVAVGYALIVGLPNSVMGQDGLVAVALFVPLVGLILGALFGVGMMRERIETDLRRTATTDPLTGVMNRRALLDRTEHELARLRRTGAPMAVLIFDLDRFKSVNDRYGHPVGDRVLVRFAEIAVANLRAADLFGRMGGEEFVAVMPGADAETARAAAERIRHAFAGAGLAADGRPLSITVSVGVAVLDARVADVATLLTTADSALYEAKAAGRDQVKSALALAS